MYSVTPHIPPSVDPKEMREIGRSMSGKGFLEIDLSTGYVTWVNDFMLKKHELSLDMVRSRSVFEMTPEEFHDQLRDSISDQMNGKFFKFSIWPIKSENGRIMWWYLNRVNFHSSYFWYRCDFLSETEVSGPFFASMTAVMYTTNSYNDLFNQMKDIDTFVKQEIERLDKRDTEIGASVLFFSQKIDQTRSAAQSAANATLDVKQAISLHEATISEKMEEYKKETSILIEGFTNDVNSKIDSHTSKMLGFSNAYNNHEELLSKFGTDMNSEISRIVKSAVEDMSIQAKKSNKNISKIVIPASAVTGIVAAASALFQHWHQLEGWIYSLFRL
jgi:hypothetical protein